MARAHEPDTATEPADHRTQPKNHRRSSPLGRETRVEVRNRFNGHWSRGFEVVDVLGDGYRLRRRSDGSVLPAVFCADDVREERHRRGTWWI